MAENDNDSFESLPLISMAQARLVVCRLQKRVKDLENRLCAKCETARKLNHERFGKDEGELARATWEFETEKRIPFEFWLYSLYEPNENDKEEHREPSVHVTYIGPGVCHIS